MAKLMGFEYDIMYLSGKNNATAYALSRRPEATLCSFSCLQNQIINELRGEVLRSVNYNSWFSK